MMILEFLIRSLRHPTRTHNVSDLDDLISGGASTGNVTLGPSDKMMLDSLHALVNAKTRPTKSPSFFLPGGKMRKTRSRSHTITQSEILNLISPETWEMSSHGASSPSKRSAAELAAHEGTAPSCSGTACLRSNQPGLSSYPPPSSSLSAGLLQCIWKDGLPHFELSVDNPMAVYTASPVKKPHGDGKAAAAADHVYLFHSDEQGKKDWMGNYSSSVSKLVGKMKVTSSLVLGSDGSRCVETEFVMYGSPDDYLRQMQSAYSVAKGKGLVKRVAEIMRSPNASSSPKHAAWGRFGRPSSPLRFDDDVREMLNAELGGAGKATGLVSLAADDLPTNQEVAAIVVRERREEPAVVGGWGLKFLEKAGGAAHPEESKKARWCISAIVPRGYHGGVASENGGPSGLVERWRNSGRCECGGWDLGCPIRVLSNDGGGSSPPPEDGAKSVELSPAGARSGGEPAVRLVSLAEGLYILYFDAGVVSPLQCFAAGVAVVHSQAPQLHPKL